MSIQTVGNLPPEAGELRDVIQEQLPEIIASFNQVLQEKYGLAGISVAQFTVIPNGPESSAGVSCDRESCSVD